MKRHYKPMLAQSADKSFTNRDWIFEIKWDGIRAITYLDDELSIRSRNNNELRQNFPELEEMKQLAENIVLDGEIVVMKGGISDFQSVLERSKLSSLKDIQFRSKESPATYVVFDILEKNDKSLIELPLEERKKILKETLKEGKHVLVSLFVDEEGELYFQEALKKGLEGVMAKKKDSRYTPGLRSSDWLKIKKLRSCDCVIFGYTAGEGVRAQDFGALILGLYDNSKPVYVGKVGTGFSRSKMKELMELFRSQVVQEKTLEGVNIHQHITWLRPKLVCEVAYQTITSDCRLRMPRFRFLRSDKMPHECNTDQVRKKDLQAYVAKRDFAVTPEPLAQEQTVEGKMFVVQEHHARRLHYDLRLEKEGVLISWAVPKGIPEDIGEKRLAVQTEDHPKEYASFEGTIPKGQYGAGTVKIWDKGTFEFKVWDENMIEFTLKGQRLQGKYVLTRFKKAGGNNWLLLKVKD